jgi:hypothetical protein
MDHAFVPLLNQLDEATQPRDQDRLTLASEGWGTVGLGSLPPGDYLQYEEEKEEHRIRPNFN